MILSNKAIYDALDQKRLIIEPEPKPRRYQPDEASPFSTHSVDLRLGEHLSIPKKLPAAFDLFDEEGQKREGLSNYIRDNSEQKVIDPASGYPLRPGLFVLGQTLEKVTLPIDCAENRKKKKCLAARIEGKSSFARTGLIVHFTAPTVHPGFSGKLTLEIINHGPRSIILRAGIPIAQLLIEEVIGLPVLSESQFQHQTRPSGSR